MDTNLSNLDKGTSDRTERRVVVDLLWDYGYGQQIALGIGRYRTLHPGGQFFPTSVKDLKRLESGSVIGAIGHYGLRESYELLRSARIPYLVNVSNRENLDVWRRLLPDDHAVGRMAANYFLRKNYRNFAVVGVEHQYAIDRAEGFVSELAKHGFNDVKQVATPLYDWWQELEPMVPLALFAVSDHLAMTSMIHLRRLGVRIPEDVAVLGVDDDAMVAPMVPVPLSSVRLPLEKIGFDACVAMDQMIRSGKPSTALTRYAPLGIVERRSSESTAVNDPLVRKATAWMQEHLADLQDMNELAAAMHMHRRSVDRQFTGATGITPWEWLLQRRVAYAERLIVETDYTVDYVAELSGLQTAVRLYRAFKKFGKPLPRVLRKHKM